MRHQTSDIPAALLTLRILWAALILGQLTFAVVVVIMWGMGAAPLQPAMAQRMLPFVVAGCGLIVPLAIFVRMQVYKANWEGDVITPRGYVTGNLVFLAMHEAGSFASLAMTMLAGAMLPYALPALVMLAIQVMSFPTGAPLHPTTPRT